MWAQLIAFAAGVWLTAAPGVLGYGNPARANDHVVGPLAATAALVAVFHVTRGVRWVNLLLGAWLVLAPLVLGYGRPEFVNSVLAGLALAGMSLLPGARGEAFGGGWRALWDSEAAKTGVSA